MEPPEVTRDEVLALYAGKDGNRVWSRQQVAERVWRNRGGQGVYDGPPRLRSEDVPLVVARHVGPVLSSLLHDKVLISAVGGEAKQIGIPFDGPQSEVRYYGLADAARQFRTEAAAAKQAREKAKWIATRLRAELGREAGAVQVKETGELLVLLTVDQASALVARLQGDTLPDTKPEQPAFLPPAPLFVPSPPLSPPADEQPPEWQSPRRIRGFQQPGSY